MSTLSHTRSRSREISTSHSVHSAHLSPPPRSPSPPTQTFHPAGILPTVVPTPALLESVAGGAHYSGFKVDPEGASHHHKRRRSSVQHSGSEDVSLDHQRVVNDLKELYSCRPTAEIFERSWTKDATFEDPLCQCSGYAEYAAQFFAMAKIISASETVASRIMSSTSAPNRIIYHQKQQYTLPLLKRKKVIESIIVIELDENDKIVSVLDQWGGRDLPAWFGASFLRRVNAKLTPWLVRVPRLHPK